MRIIDNKAIDLTDEEFSLYQKICAGYPQGQDLFRGLFETDDDGCIIFIYPPTKPISMEVIIFIQNTMISQNLRRIYKEHDQALSELKEMKRMFEEKIKERLG